MEKEITLRYMKTKQTNKQALLMSCSTIHNDHVTSRKFTLSYLTHGNIFKFISFWYI